MAVFLVNLKPKEVERESEDKSDKKIREEFDEIFEFCKKECIFGTAWPLHEDGIVFDREGVEPLEIPAGKEEVKSYMESYDKFLTRSGKKLTSTLRYLYNDELQDSILVHHHRGSGWYLAKIPENAEVEYKTGPEFSKHYMFHVIDVEDWKHVNPQHLPSSILRSTSQGGAIKKKRIDDVEEDYLRKLYEKDDLEIKPDIEELKNKLEDCEPSEVLKKIGPNEVEDVILAYLQFEKEANSRGSPVLWQSSYTSSLPEIEYVLKHVDDGGEEYSIYVQAKTGKQKINESNAKKFSEVLNENDRFYIYQEAGTIENNNFIELDEKEIYEFLKRTDNLKKMPSSMLYRLQKSL